jgi:hypothetical protein
MSPLAWKLLRWAMTNQWNFSSSLSTPVSFKSWLLGNVMENDIALIRRDRVWDLPSNPYELALRELLDKGLVEEVPGVPDCWRLVVNIINDQKGAPNAHP